MNIKLGIVGLGRWASKYIETISKNFPNVQISCASRSKPVKPDFLPESTYFFDRWEDMINAGWFDGLIVCAHPGIHVDVALAAVDQGMPIMIEKPLAFSYDEASRLAKTKPSAPILVNHVHLFSPAYSRMKEMISGRVKSIKTEGSNNGPFRDYSSLYDYGPHDVAMCLDLTNTDPIRVSCSRTGRVTNPSHGDLFDIDLDFGNFISKSKVGNAALKRSRSVHLQTDSQDFLYDDVSSTKLCLNDKNTHISSEAPLKCAIQVFLDSMMGKPDNRLGLKLALRTASILDICANQCNLPKVLDF